MSLSGQMGREQSGKMELAFFQYFYSHNYQPNGTWRPLKEKFKNFKQQSYATPKHSNDINFIKRLNEICQYIPYLPQQRPQKIEIPLLQQIIEDIYDENEEFFVIGGWKAVKNKSLKARLQEHLLLKLWKTNQSQKMAGGIGSFVLGFFYTLNYYKTCNYEIRLFNQFLVSAELQSFFLFILLRKKSRRVGKDLTIKSENIAAFVQILKGERSNPTFGSFASEFQEIGEVKLLLIYPQIIEYIQNNSVVLHQVMIYSLMESADLVVQKTIIDDKGKIDWNQFLNLCFSELRGQKSYQQELLSRVVKANLKMAQNIPEAELSVRSGQTDCCSNIRQKFLQQSFGWLIGVLTPIIYGGQQCNKRWRKMFIELQMLYDFNMTLGNRLVEQLFKSQEYFSIYTRYSCSYS